jgi:hypothetical protein
LKNATWTLTDNYNLTNKSGNLTLTKNNGTLQATFNNISAMADSRTNDGRIYNFTAHFTNQNGTVSKTTLSVVEVS